MTKQTITFKFYKDLLHVEATLEAELQLGHSYYFDIPRLDLTKWGSACVEIKISDHPPKPPPQGGA